jgi:Fe-S-cluster containining protein
MKIEELYAAWDKAMRECAAGWPDAYRCPEACAACCENSPAVPIAPAEAAVLARAVETLEPEQREIVKRRSAAIVGQMEDKDRPLVKDVAERSLGERSGLRGVCPLLVDGRCAVYEARPLICRAYGFTADENGFFMGCELLGEILKRNDVTLLPTWDAAFRLIPTVAVLDARGMELPPQGTLAEMLERILK